MAEDTQRTSARKILRNSTFLRQTVKCNRVVSVEGCTASEPQRTLDALAEGKLVVALMTKGHFTSSGHFIVLRGVQDGNILVADSASYSRSQKKWELSTILSEASRSAVAGGPFWIIG